MGSSDWPAGIDLAGDEAHPVDRYRTPGYSEGVAVADGHAFVAGGSSGLQVIDVRAPSAPTVVEGYATSDYSRDVALAADRVFVADCAGGLRIRRRAARQP